MSAQLLPHPFIFALKLNDFSLGRMKFSLGSLACLHNALKVNLNSSLIVNEYGFSSNDFDTGVDQKCVHLPYLFESVNALVNKKLSNLRFINKFTWLFFQNFHNYFRHFVQILQVKLYPDRLAASKGANKSVVKFFYFFNCSAKIKHFKSFFLKMHLPSESFIAHCLNFFIMSAMCHELAAQTFPIWGQTEQPLATLHDLPDGRRSEAHLHDVQSAAANGLFHRAGQRCAGHQQVSPRGQRLTGCSLGVAEPRLSASPTRSSRARGQKVPATFQSEVM